jgi:hypothetical protein
MTARPDLDLDSPAAEAPPATAGAGFLLLAVLLIALAAGALLGAVLAPPVPPQYPSVARLSARDVYVDPATDASQAAREGSLVGRPVLIARLLVDNPGRSRAVFTALVLDGVARQRITQPLALRVAPGGSAFADVIVRPQCSGTRPSTPPAARLLTRSEPSGSVPVSLSRGLNVVGGFCTLFDTRLPNGWRFPRQALDSRLEGLDLVVTVPDLSADGLSGIVVDGLLLPTVFVSDQLLSSSALLRPGENTVLRLRGPPPCTQSDGTEPIPTTVRLLADSDGGVQQRLVIIGPELARWLRLTCPE